MAGLFADVEALVIAFLEEEAETRTLAELPAEITEPLIQVLVFGGADTSPATDLVNIDVDVYVPPGSDGEPAAPAAHDLAELVRHLMLNQLPGTTTAVGGATGTVTTVRTIARPIRRPYDESGVRRVHASYAVRVNSRG